MIMKTMLLMLAVYIIPIIIICIIIYLLMEKGQTIEEFCRKTNCLNPTFIACMIIPCVNIAFMICCIGIYLCYKLKDWKK